MFLSGHQDNRLTINQAEKDEQSIFGKQYSCILSNFTRNSKNQVKQVDHSKTAYPSGYSHQNDCFGHVFRHLKRSGLSGYPVCLQQYIFETDEKKKSHFLY